MPAAMPTGIAVAAVTTSITSSEPTQADLIPASAGLRMTGTFGETAG